MNDEKDNESSTIRKYGDDPDIDAEPEDLVDVIVEVSIDHSTAYGDTVLFRSDRGIRGKLPVPAGADLGRYCEDLVGMPLTLRVERGLTDLQRAEVEYLLDERLGATDGGEPEDEGDGDDGVPA